MTRTYTQKNKKRSCKESCPSKREEEIPTCWHNYKKHYPPTQDAIRQRRIEQWHKDIKKARGEPDLGDPINID